jgi:hypothetical protein
MATRRTTAVVHSLEATDLMTLVLHDFGDIFTTPTGLPQPQSPDSSSPRHGTGGRPALSLSTVDE